jgi:hypothetical protein
MNVRAASSRFIVAGVCIVLFSANGFPKSWQSQSESSVPLEDILQRAGDRVQQYTASILNVVCTESTRRQELEPDLKTEKNKPIELAYDFFIVLGSSFGIREQRELKLINGKPPAKNERAPVPDTTAYTTAVVILLPEIRKNYTFTDAGIGDLDGRRVLIVDYVPAIRRPPSVSWEGARFRVNLQSKGRIWIDPESYDVLRLDSHLTEPYEFRSPKVAKKGPFVLFGPTHTFKMETSDVSIRFGSASFKDPEQTLMLPVSAESFQVFEGTRVPRIRITHSFTNYRRFTSEVKISH